MDGLETENFRPQVSELFNSTQGARTVQVCNFEWKLIGFCVFV